MMTRRRAALALGAGLASFAAGKDTQGCIRTYRIPSGGIQPQAALDASGTLHLVYYNGDAHHGDLFLCSLQRWRRQFFFRASG